MQRLRVWLVDDIEANRHAFQERHSQYFDLRMFETPDEVLQALETDRPPDALLCDIFFYDDPQKARGIEDTVKSLAEKLRQAAFDLGANTAEVGIGLIRAVRDKFNGDPPFPIYAYTSKGPYLLLGDGFNRLEQLEALWLFKNKYEAPTERQKIRDDVAKFQEHRNWWLRAWKIALASGLLGAILGVVLDIALRYLFNV
jgi:CheY-like chemotaxis protein